MPNSPLLLSILPLALFAVILLSVMWLRKRREIDLATRLRDASPWRRFLRGPFALPLILILITLLLALIKGHF